MPSAGLGGLGARGGVRVWTSGAALHASTGSTFISLPEVLFLLFLLVLGQQEVQEEGHDEADGVGRLQQDDRRRPVRVLALVVLGAARAVVICARAHLRARLGVDQHAPLLFVHVRTCAPVDESTLHVL